MQNRQFYDEIVKLAKYHKMAWVETTNAGDMNPTIIGLRDGTPQLLVVTPMLDKNQGLKVVQFLRVGMAIDEVVLVVDGHTILTRGKSKEEIERLQEKYVGKAGSMQKACDEEGACSLGEIADSLVVHHLNKNRRISLGSYPYFYHGKDGGAEFRWLEEDKSEMLDVPLRLDEKNPPKGESVGGYVPCTLYQIMEEPTHIDSKEGRMLMKLSGFDPDNPEDRKQAMFHQGVGVRKILEHQGFITFEYLAFSDNYESFLENMAEKYATILRVQESPNIPDADRIDEIFAKMETDAQGDPEALAQIQKWRKKGEQAKGEA